MSVLEARPNYAVIPQNFLLTPKEDIPTPIGSVPSQAMTPTQVARLINFGNILAGLLAIVLDQVRVYDTQAAYSILSIVEPFREESKGLDIDMHQEISSEVTDAQNTSFFRFLDELEARTYKPDDTEDEE